MANETFDQAFARHVRQIGLVTPEQIHAAQQTQGDGLKQGKTFAFSEVLVQMGVITATQRDSLEKKVREQQAGIQQLGDYRLIKKIGEGGMGSVYLAQDPGGINVAVKVLPRHLGANAEFVKRFRREAEAATRLKHPNIIGAFAAGEDLGYHYYVMEYCDGTPVDKLLVAQKSLPSVQAVAITLQVARGLKYAHDLGIIHRDIKPSNIMIDRNGEAKLLDLGLSKDLGETALSFRTVTGAVLGTPHYISPEQAQGERSVDGRSDIYSLGATLYHLITGRTPFDGATALEILSKHVNTVLPNPQDIKEEIPDPVVHVLERMMAKHPSDRYSDCGELIAELVEASQGRAPKSEAIAPSKTSIAPPARRALAKRRPATVRRAVPDSGARNLPLIGGLAAAAAAVILAIVMMSGRREPVVEPTTIGPTTRPPEARTGEPPKAGFDVAAWEKSVAELPPEARVKNVHARLRTLNPGYDASSSEHQINHGRVVRLRLSHPSLRDLGPLRALPDLRELEIVRTDVSDLSPLQDSKLSLLVLETCKVSDLRPLRGMKELNILSMTGLPLKDLAPLEGLDLARLTVKDCPVADLSPLRRIRLRELYCDFDPKRDTDVLKSMPALEQINGVPVEEFWRKQRGSEPASTADAAPPSVQDPASAILAALRKLNPEWGGRESHTIENGAVTELTLVAIGLTDVSPVSSLKSLRRLDLSGYWSTSEQKEYRSRLKDLSPLRGLPLRELNAHHTDVSDLSPLQGMPLEELYLNSTEVQDLAPLKGMHLRVLQVSWTHVRSLVPLAEIPLYVVRASHVDPSIDLTPLQRMPLRLLEADLSPQKHLALISSIRTLETVNGAPVAEFLKDAAPAPPPPDAALWKNAIDLIPAIDPVRDIVVGPWRKDGGKVYCDGGENAVLRVPYEPPAEYDYRIVYFRQSGTCATAQFLTREGRNFFFEMGGYGNNNSGIANIDGRGSSVNPTRSPLTLRGGQRYTSLIEVRRDRVTAYVDGKKLSEWLPSMGELSADGTWCVDIPGLIGLGNCESYTTFEVIQVRDVTGRGRLRLGTSTPPDAAFLKTVASLPPAEQVRRVAEKLRDLNLAFDPGSVRYKIENERVTEFSCGSSKLTDVWPVRAFPFLRKLELGDERAPGLLADLGFLKGLKLSELSLFNTRVVDLSPLQGVPLTRLQLAGSSVRDLSPLRGSKLAWLSITGTPVLDFAPLRDVPLQRLELDRNVVGDLTPLKSIRTLKTVNDVPLAEFLKLAKDGWAPVFDGRTTDCLRNTLGWKVDRGTLVNDSTGLNSAQTRFEFENGDLKVRFEGKGGESLFFRVRQNEKGATGVFFDAVACRALEGRPHEILFSCRGDAVTVSLDGKPVAPTETQPSRSGCLQFNTTGALRVFSIEYRPAP
jgi:serine/threonine-protein kinase